MRTQYFQRFRFGPVKEKIFNRGRIVLQTVFYIQPVLTCLYLSEKIGQFRMSRLYHLLGQVIINGNCFL